MLRTRIASILATLAAAPLAASAAPITIVNETFSDGDRLNTVATPDPLSMPWYNIRSGAGVTTGIVDDSSGIGSGNALSFSSTQTVKPFALGALYGTSSQAAQSSVTLAEQGDVLRLSANVRFSTVQANGAGFRFGLFNSNGTPTSADENNTTSFNDFGYRILLGTGGTSGSEIAVETGTQEGPTAGSDVTRLDATTSTAGTSLVANTTYRVALQLTRTGTGLDILTEVRNADGSSVLATESVSHTSATPFLTFNQIAFGLGNAQPFAGTMDNITLTYTPVPEPASLALLGAGALLMISRRRGA